MLYLLIEKFAADTIENYIGRNGNPVPVKRVEIGNGKAIFAGDTHGALDISAHIVSRLAGFDLACFLGDIVDRGKDQLYNLLFLLESSLLDSRIIIVRGNHESPMMNISYGFMDELRRLGSTSLFPAIGRLYGTLPYAVLVNGRVLGVHGGIPSGCSKLEQWDRIPMGEGNPDDRCGFEILWNDPSETVKGFSPGPRGSGTMVFGMDVLGAFLDENGLDVVIRGHEVQTGGFSSLLGGRLFTVFSSRYHRGGAAFLKLTFGSKIEVVPELLPPEITDNKDSP